MESCRSQYDSGRHWCMASWRDCPKLKSEAAMKLFLTKMIRSSMVLLMSGCAAPAVNSQLGLDSGATAAEHKANSTIQSQAAAEYQNGGFARSAAQAGEVILARLVSVEFSEPDQDRFLTTTRWTIERSFKGGLSQAAEITVRFPSGRQETGDWKWTANEPAISPLKDKQFKPGQRFVLLLSRPMYEAQAQARSGRALDGKVGAGLGYYRVNGEKIVPSGPDRPPATIAELAAILGKTP